MSMADYYHGIATLAFFIFSALVTTGQAQPSPWQLCNTSSGNYTVNSTYKANIQYLATSLPQYAASSPSLFASGSSGTSPDVIYALALCRGDTNASSCATCVAASIQSAEKLCPLMKTVTTYDDRCILRFSDKGFPITHPYNRGMIIAWSFNNISAAESRPFEAATAKLISRTVEYAAADPIRRFGTGVVAFDQSYPKVYSLAQCTPDMTADQCRSCLGDIIGRFTQTYFAGKQGGRVLGVRCNFRFETYPFFYGSPLLQLAGPSPGPSPAPAASTATGEGTRVRKSIVLAIAVPTVAAAVVLTTIVAWLCLWRRTKPEDKALQPMSTSPDDIQSIGSLVLNLSTLRVATDDFSDHRRLGEGGFGVVYKGELPHGQEIAVKRLAQTSTQGIEELKTELILVAKLNHKNLVRLIGVCLEEKEKIVVYEYVPNRSLDKILFDAAKAKELDWEQRFNIICGIARGLQYLHEDSQLKIIHRDLKASNVLLDSAYNPKISDFGLAKIFGRDQSKVFTHRIAGTYGYMSPEYAMRGQYSIKSDVFSFGVLLLEIVTGRRNCGSYDSDKDIDLINLTWEHWTRDKSIDLIDPSLSCLCPIDKVMKCIHIGLWCVQQKPTDRPLMSAVNFMLSSSTVRLPSLSRPTIWFPENGPSSNVISEPTTSISYSTAIKMSRNDVSISVLEPR